jgi:hypothetical protein
MADHNKPLSSSTYANFVSELDARLDDLTVGLDPAVVTPTNLATNAIRWNSASAKWQKWSGTTWGDLSALYGINISGNANSVNNGVYTNVSYANPVWITSIAGSKVDGDITGKAATAAKLVPGANINGQPFDGSAAINVNVNNSLTFNNSGSGAASGTTFNGSSARTISYNTVGAPSTSGTGATGTGWDISINGNAGSASVPAGGGSFITTLNIASQSVTSATNATNSTNASKLLTTNFTVEESGGKLLFKYGSTVIASMTSAGLFTALNNVKAGGTP